MAVLEHLGARPSLVCVIALVLLYLLSILLQLVRSPLRRIPGPSWAKISHLPLLYHSFRGNRAHWILGLHKQYGPVIRISPTKVCVADDSGIKAIYSNKAVKSSAYNGFRYHDVKMCIGLLDVKSAHLRRKGLLPAFSHQNLMEMEPVIRFHLERFLTWLETFDRSGEYIDCFKWFRYLTFDVITDIAFGQQIGMLVKEDDNFIRHVEYRNKRNGLVSDKQSSLRGGHPLMLHRMVHFHFFFHCSK